MIIFMGVAGSGKSLQGRLLADNRGLPWVSTGEFLRMLITGEKRKEMLSGKLLGDEDIIALIQQVFQIVDTDEEFVLDGFPRTVEQAEWLLTQVKFGQLSIGTVIHLVASRQVVTERLLSRGRQDDHDVAINERFNEFEQTITPILQRFKEAGINVVDVDGEGTIGQVQQNIVKVVQAA